MRPPSDRLVARKVIGEPAEVRTALGTAYRAGRLVHADPPRELADGRVVVAAVLREPAPALPAPRDWRLWRWAGGTACALAALAGLVLLLHAAWLWAVAHWDVVLGVLAAGWLVAYGLGRLGVCPGVHCPGCRHR